MLIQIIIFMKSYLFRIYNHAKGDKSSLKNKIIKHIIITYKGRYLITTHCGETEQRKHSFNVTRQETL